MRAKSIHTTYCTTKEAAEILRVHPSQLTRYVQAGRLMPERVGQQMLFRRRDIERFVPPGRGFRSDLAS